MRLRSLLPVVLVVRVLAVSWNEVRAEEPAASAASEKTPTIKDLQAALESKSIDVDTIWVLITGFLVMWMQAGFAMVETGFTRAKNSVNILMENLLDYCFGTVAFWAVGVLAVFAWCVVTGVILFTLLKYTVGLRVSREEEMDGLDVGEHGNTAYHGFVMSTSPEL